MRFLFFALLLACTESHLAPDAGPIDSDAGTLADAGPHDSGIDAAPVSRCEPVAHAQFGEGCFCQGPIAIHRGHLYRQSVGIEVFDLADPIAPTRVRVVEERSSSMGGLVIVDDNLISLGEFPISLRVYSLGDPSSPSLVGQLALPMDARPAALAAMGHGVVAASIGVDGSSVYGVQLAPASMPEILWDIPIDGEVEGVAVDGPRALVLSTRRVAGAPQTLVTEVDLGSGAAQPPVVVDGDESFGRRIAVALGVIAITGRDPALRTYSLVGGVLTPRGALPADGSNAFGIDVRDDLAIIAGGPFQVVDLAGGVPTVLGATGTMSDSFYPLFAEVPGVAYVSGGNGTVPVTLGCR